MKERPEKFSNSLWSKDQVGKYINPLTLSTTWSFPKSTPEQSYSLDSLIERYREAIGLEIDQPKVNPTITYSEFLFSGEGSVSWHNPPEKRKYFDEAVGREKETFEPLHPDSTSIVIIPVHREPEIITLRTLPTDSTTAVVINVNDNKGAPEEGAALNEFVLEELHERPATDNLAVMDRTQQEWVSLGRTGFPHNSIGFARAFATEGAIRDMQAKQGDAALELPVIWTDADAYAQEGYYGRVEAFYKENPDVIAAYAQARSMILPGTEPLHILGDSAFQYTYLTSYIEKGTPERALGGPVLTARAKFFTREVRGEETRTGVRVNDMISSARSNEDFQLMLLLEKSDTAHPDEHIVPIPDRVFISPRGKEERSISAIGWGDAATGNNIHPIAEDGWYFTEFVKKLSTVVETFQPGLEASLSEVTTRNELLQKMPEIKANLDQSEAFRDEYAIEEKLLKEQPGSEMLYATDEGKNIIDASLTLYALHMSTLKKVLAENGRHY